MHTLIHSWAQERLTLDSQRELTREPIELIARGLRLKREDDYLANYMSFEQRIIPHLDAALNNIQKLLSISSQPELNIAPPPKWSMCLGPVCVIYEIAEGWYLWARAIIEDIISYAWLYLYTDTDIESNSEVWWLAYKLGFVCRDQGLIHNAKSLYRWTLHEARTRLYGSHPKTLAIAGDLAWVIYLQERCDEALGWYEWVLSARRRTLGKTHPSTFGAVKGIASVHKCRMEYEAALRSYNNALEGRKKSLGKDDSLTLNVVIDIAEVFQEQGQHDKALEWYSRALTGREKTLGEEHSDTLRIVNLIAITFDN